MNSRNKDFWRRFLFGPDDSSTQCPDEADMLKYYEGSQSERRHRRMASHLSNCDGCRETLALLARVGSGESEEEALPHITEEQIRTQAARVRTMMAEDEAKRGLILVPPAMARPARRALVAAYAAVALTGAGGALLWAHPTEPSPDSVVSESLDMVKGVSLTSQVWISGFPWARPISRRGAAAPQDDRLDLALSSLKSLEGRKLSRHGRLNEARVRLAMVDPSQARIARSILAQLVRDGLDSAEVRNDLGVALIQIGDNKAAIVELTEALARNPQLDEALFNKALAEQQAGLNDDSFRDWNEFIQTSRDDNWKREAEQHLRNLGRPSL
jgi:tetratricopeptide (TPR) repeat protein